MLSVQLVNSIEGMLSIEPEWNALLENCDTHVPFLSPEWLACWWSVFGRGKEMCILAVRENGRIAAIAPLMRSIKPVRGVPVTAVSFIDDHRSERNGFLMKEYDPYVTETIFSYLKSWGSRWDVIALNSVPKKSHTEKAIKDGAALHGVRLLERNGDSSPFIPIETEWQEYFNGRSRNFRHKLKRISNLFDREGGTEVVLYKDKEIGQAMQELKAVSINTWKFKNGTAIASGADNIRFYSGLAGMAAQKGWLNLWMLKHNGAPIAFAYNLIWGRKVFALKIGFDENYREMSPSEFLNLHAIRDAFENKYTEYEWLGKPLAFKMKWTSVCREHSKYMIFNNTVRGMMLSALERNIIPAVKRVLRF